MPILWNSHKGGVGMNILEVNHLKKYYRSPFLRKRVRAVEDISFAVKQGEIFGLLGPNGAGKTTTLKSIVGLLKPDGGEIRLFGRPLDISRRERIGFLPENPYFYRHLTGYELLSFYAHLFNKHITAKKIKEILEMVGLEHAMHSKVGSYSKGMLQRVGFAQAILNDPDFIILDEPMSGLDPIGRKEMKDWIFKLKSEGKTILFSSHILPDVEMICDRVAIIYRGRVVSTGVLSEILQEKVRFIEVTIEGLDEKTLETFGKVFRSGDKLMLRLTSEEEKDRLVSFVIEKGGRIISVAPYRKTLEEHFMETLEAQ
ncbi:ABC transporter ATP-binding protein [bacterium]|nr:MAG: ABC transporter ATP-binding protein [bacterium]